MEDLSQTMFNPHQTNEGTIPIGTSTHIYEQNSGSQVARKHQFQTSDWPKLSSI
jgi:hypothetical protein